MDRNIKIEIKDRIAYLVGNPKIICGNNDYSVTFTFDDEWTGVDVKTLRVSYNNKYSDHVFAGDTVELPPIIRAVEVYLGVFAGDITSTKVAVRAEPSILCAGGSVADPEPDVYDQIINLINSMESSGGSGGGVPGEPGEDGGYYVPHIDANGDLSWTPSDKDMPAVDTVNIKGAKGDKGEPGEPGRDGVDATSYTLPTASADTLGGVKIGEGLQMDGDALRVKHEGVYELIETIILEEDALVERTAEPDGTPYKFQAMSLKSTTTGMQETSCRMYYFSDDISVGSSYYGTIASAGTRYKIDIIEQVFGYWQMMWSDWKTNNSTYSALETGGANMLLTTGTNECPSITKIRTNKALPAGTTIEIWGVRANA